MAAGELSTAEASYAAIDAVDKLQFVLHLRSLAGGGGAAGSGGDAVVAAKLAMYGRQPDEAEAVLLQVGALRNNVQHQLHVPMFLSQRGPDLGVLLCRMQTSCSSDKAVQYASVSSAVDQSIRCL